MMQPKAGVNIENIRKAFGAAVALDGVSLDIAPGEIVTLLGPSGCGKTTLLRIVAGFVSPDQGDVKIDGVSILDLPAHRSPAGMVFQSYALFPHLSVARNVAFGLEVRRRPGGEVQEAVRRTLALVGLSGLEERRPHQLSGGQQQRVALARVLAIEPRVLLLDEPFGALDKKLRAEMQVEVSKIVREMKVTTIFVTHDQEEALVLSDRIAVMNQGRVIQVGPGLDIYRRPATEFVADFLGNANLLEGTVAGSEAGGRLRVEVEPGFQLEFQAQRPLKAGQRVKVLIRPENLRLNPRLDSGAGFEGEVAFAVHFGTHAEYRIRVSPDTTLLARSDEAGLGLGERVKLGVAREAECLLYVDGVCQSAG